MISRHINNHVALIFFLARREILKLAYCSFSSSQFKLMISLLLKKKKPIK